MDNNALEVALGLRRNPSGGKGGVWNRRINFFNFRTIIYDRRAKIGKIYV